MQDPLTIRRLYGRRQGHPLRQAQSALVDELLPKLAVPPKTAELLSDWTPRARIALHAVHPRDPGKERLRSLFLAEVARAAARLSSQ